MPPDNERNQSNARIIKATSVLGGVPLALSQKDCISKMIALYILSLAGVISLLFRALQVYRIAVPGPWYTNLTSLVLKYHEFNRNRRLWIHELHKLYGPVVRLSPNEVSFANLDGIKEIYQSGGSGYDKTEFYDLFKQYNHR